MRGGVRRGRRWVKGGGGGRGSEGWGWGGGVNLEPIPFGMDLLWATSLYVSMTAHSGSFLQSMQVNWHGEKERLTE